jgi:glycosyltransferase involved in cell wall biosynthesis
MVIAGSGDIQGARDLIIFLGLENKVSVRPWLNPQERDELLFSSDVFLLPSYNEGLPMSMLEAMAFGLPVIVTPVGGIPEIVIHGREGLIVLPGHIDELSHAMKLLIDDKKKREEMGKQALLRVVPLCIENYMDTLRSIYRKASCLR